MGYKLILELTTWIAGARTNDEREVKAPKIGLSTAIKSYSTSYQETKRSEHPDMFLIFLMPSSLYSPLPCPLTLDY